MVLKDDGSSRIIDKKIVVIFDQAFDYGAQRLLLF